LLQLTAECCAKGMLDTKWFFSPRPLNSPAGRLFCFPFAGGGCGTFLEWPRYFGEDLEIICVQLPGRGKRFSEQPFTSVPPLVTELGRLFVNCRGVPFAFFGHSMGSLIAYELACHLQMAGGPQPSCIFVSGTEAPQLVQEKEYFISLSDSELVEVVRRMNGMPDEVLKNPELLELLLPVLRADFILTGTYKHTDYILSCGITAFCGSDDKEATVSDVHQWKRRTAGEFRMHTITGDHFFINSARDQVLELVKDNLRTCFDEPRGAPE